MFHRITCPTCSHKFTIPEAAMGQRQTCPNCQALFLAGKSVAEAAVPMKLQPAAAAGAAPLNKTMLGETEPPIKYNCPRCKKPLESPAIEAGTKKPCPACGGRLQVPAAPPPAAPQPNMNKTILATDESKAQPTSVQAEAPPPKASPAPPPMQTVPADHTRPAEHSPLRPLMFAGLGLFGVIFLVLLSCIAVGLLTGGRKDETALAKAQQELEKLKAEIKQRETDMEKARLMEAERKQAFDNIMADAKRKQDALDAQRELDRNNARYRDDKKAAQEAQDRLDEKQRQIEREKTEAAQKQQQFQDQMKAQLAATQKALEAANQRQTTIIQQPAPVYYPPYHPRYYWGW